MANPMGQIVDTSHSHGLRVCELWCLLFADNERFWEREEVVRILSDPQITLAMRNAFPRRQCQVFGQVNKVRLDYNQGRLGVLPVRRSYAYRKHGNQVIRCTARGKTLMIKEFVPEVL